MVPASPFLLETLGEVLSKSLSEPKQHGPRSQSGCFGEIGQRSLAGVSDCVFWMEFPEAFFSFLLTPIAPRATLYSIFKRTRTINQQEVSRVMPDESSVPQSPKARARTMRRAARTHRQVARVKSIVLNPTNIQMLTGTTLKQLAAWKRHGHIDTIDVPKRIPRGKKNGNPVPQVNILGFRDLVTVIIIKHLQNGGFSEETIFERCTDNPRSRGLLLRCEAALAQRHGTLDEQVLMIRRKKELDVSVTKNPTVPELSAKDVLIVDFQRIIPAMITEISQLKRRRIPVDLTIIGASLPNRK